MPSMSFVVLVRCGSMYETHYLLLHGKYPNNLAILRYKFRLKYQNLHVFTEKKGSWRQTQGCRVKVTIDIGIREA